MPKIDGSSLAGYGRGRDGMVLWLDASRTNSLSMGIGMLTRDHDPDKPNVGAATVSAALKDAGNRAGRLTTEVIDNIREQFQETGDILEVLFEAYFDIRSYDRVEQLGTRILERDPSKFALRLRIIKLLTERRRTAEIRGDAWAIARTHLQTAERQTGLTRKDWIDISACYVALKEYASALPPARKAVEMSEGSGKVSACLCVAEVLLACGDRVGAGRELKRIRRELSGHDQLTRGALLSQEVGLADEVMELARRAALCLPPAEEAPYSYIKLGRLFFKRNALEEGRSVLMQAGVVRLKNGAIMRRLHDVCFDLALSDLALAHGMAALEILTDDYELYERVQLLKLLQKHPSGLAGPGQAGKRA